MRFHCHLFLKNCHVNLFICWILIFLLSKSPQLLRLGIAFAKTRHVDALKLQCNCIPYILNNFQPD